MRTFITFILVAFLGFISYAQDMGKPLQENKAQHGHNGKKHPSKEEIQSQKIAYFTQELRLTPAEAQKFWPVYNQGWERAEQARHNINSSLRKLHDALKAEEKVSDNEIKKLMENYFTACKEEIRYQSEFFDELSKVVPVEKAAKTFSLEERFRIMLIKQLRR